MTNREFCIERRKAERPAFLKVLKALPPDQLDYRPHARSRSAAEVAWVIASEEGDLATLIDTGVLDWKPEKAPTALEEIVAAYERNAASVDQRLAQLDEAGWERKGKFLANGTPVWEDTLGGFCWGFLFDAVHHRGQLSVYLRPMGGKVPAIYGPSGDEQ